MLYTEYISLNSISIHLVGNRLNAEGVKISPKEIDLSDNLKKILTSYFITSFKSNEYFNFYHESDLNLNEVFTYVSKIFDDPHVLYKQSINLAKHLYEQSTHPKIKGGEFSRLIFKTVLLTALLVMHWGCLSRRIKTPF